MITRTLTSKTEILRILEGDRLYAAYAIGDLTGALFERCQWAIAENGGGPCALAMAFSGLHTPALFVMGDSKGIGAILRAQLRLPQVQATLRPEHMAAVSGIYRVSDDRRMWRMAVDSETFRLAPGAGVRMHAGDLAELNTLYSWGGPNFFAADQLEHGVYYAVKHQGALVAAAGTHVVTPDYGVACVGNVYTHPDHRNKGYATACTGAVAAELLAMGCRWIVLNVRQDNTPAVRAYDKLGFRVHCEYIESPGRRRNSIEQAIRRVISP